MATNLHFIKSFNITETVTNFDCDNVFSDAYDIYKIHGVDFHTAGSTSYTNMRLIDSSGNVESGSNYSYAYLSVKDDGSFGQAKSTADSKWQEFFGNADKAPEGSGTIGYIYSPYQSAFTFCSWQSFHQQNSTERMYKAAGVFKLAESMRGFRIYDSLSAPLTSGQVNIYGIK